MQHEFTNAVLFSKHGDHQQLALLASRAIITLLASWGGVMHRNPWVNGGFRVFYSNPGHSAFRPEDIAADTGYKIGRFTSEQGIAVVGGRYKLPEIQRWGTRKPDIAALCAGKKPAFVEFDQAGHDNRILFAQALAVAAELTVQGYYGVVRCYSDAIDNREFDNPECCTISIDEDGLLYIRIHWGSEILVGPLLDLCRAELFTEEPGWEDWEKSRKTA